eukprot:Seg91.6 transcript_id=Seg91.6/GoldUCD/mRNA.D3Y31 product="Serine/threonine-protein phosphatase 6 regulatory ankyrin repeat subunit C" protein_id=Seg91.6/GoldUCD/D3Y31
MHLAAAVDYPEMIELLYKYGALLECRTKGEFQTPIHYAAKNNAVYAAKCLMRLGADPTAKDYKQRTPVFVAAETGHGQVLHFFLEEGLPMAVYDSMGNSAIALMYENIPDVAYSALMQHMEVDTVRKLKQLHLSALELDPGKDVITTSNAKSVFQVFTENEDTDLLNHPVTKRLLQIKWNMYGRGHAVRNLLVNMLFAVMVISAAIMISAAVEGSSSEERIKIYKQVLDVSICVLNIGFITQQTYLAIQAKKLHQRKQDARIEYLEKDLKFCHPRWPHEKRFLDATIGLLKSQVSVYFKRFSTYFEWLTAAIMLLQASFSFLHTFDHEREETHHRANKVVLAIAAPFACFRLMNALRPFPITGKFIAILGNVAKASLQFAFLFFIFFVPFTVTFWIFFGGEEIEKQIKAKHPDVNTGGFKTFNNVVYTVWTMTILVGFPVKYLEKIDRRLAHICISLYYGMMAVLSLNLFVALLSQSFTTAYRKAVKLTLLERAKSLLIAEKSLSDKKRKKYLKYLHSECRPLIEDYDIKEELYPKEMLHRIALHETRRKQRYFEMASGDISAGNNDMGLRILLGSIKGDIMRTEHRIIEAEESIGTLQKLYVENLKLRRILGLGVAAKKKKASESAKRS